MLNNIYADDKKSRKITQNAELIVAWSFIYVLDFVFVSSEGSAAISVRLNKNYAFISVKQVQGLSWALIVGISDFSHQEN